MSELEALARQSWNMDDQAMYAWRDEALKDRLFKDDGTPKEDDEANLIRQLGPGFLVNMRIFAQHTRKFRNFIIDGAHLDDPIEVFICLAGDLSGGTLLVSEIKTAFEAASVLKGDELKNFVGQCAGESNPETSTVPPVQTEDSP